MFYTSVIICVPDQVEPLKMCLRKKKNVKMAYTYVYQYISLHNKKSDDFLIQYCPYLEAFQGKTETES